MTDGRWILLEHREIENLLRLLSRGGEVYDGYRSRWYLTAFGILEVRYPVCHQPLLGFLGLNSPARWTANTAATETPDVRLLYHPTRSPRGRLTILSKTYSFQREAGHAVELEVEVHEIDSEGYLRLERLEDRFERRLIDRVGGLTRVDDQELTDLVKLLAIMSGLRGTHRRLPRTFTPFPLRPDEMELIG